MHKFKLLLFIDDDDATNFYHEHIIEQADVCEKYLMFQKAEEALEYLKNLTKDDQMPDAIFLDINMPKVDGWMFLEEYEKLHLTKAPVIIMLTTSLRPSDEERAKQNQLVYKFLNKPLSEDHLHKLRNELHLGEEEE